MNTDPAGTEPDGIDTVLADTFAAHEHLAPHHEDVLVELEGRFRQPPRSGYVRPLAAAAGVAAVAAAALGLVALTRPDPSGTTRTPPAANSPTTTQTSPPPVTVAPVTMPFDLSWLPSGTVVYGARRINDGGRSEHSAPDFDGEYLFEIRRTHSIDVDVQQMPGGLHGVGFKSGAGRDITINGRAGVESAHAGGPGGYEIYFKTARGLVYVNVSTHFHSAATPTDQLFAIGRHIARAVRFPGTTRYEPAFGIGYVPPGDKVNTFDLESNAFLGIQVAHELNHSTSYEIGSPTSQHQTFTVTQQLSRHSGRHGRDVQGHPTRLTNEDGYRSITVLHAVHGTAVEVAGQRSFAALYKIADGLILPS